MIIPPVIFLGLSVAGSDRSAERLFASELLEATREGRVAWTGTGAPECYQFVAGSHVLVIRPGDEGGPVISLHHRNGHILDTIVPAQDGDDGAQFTAVLAEVYKLARGRALGLGRVWRAIGRHLAANGGGTSSEA